MAISRDNLFQHQCESIWVNIECMKCQKFKELEFPYTDDEAELTDDFRNELESEGWDEDEQGNIICNDCTTKN